MSAFFHEVGRRRSKKEEFKMSATGAANKSMCLCGCQSIWDLMFEEYWEECDQLSDTHVIVHNTLILICLLLNAFLDIASFKPCYE